ncbi:phage resistance protein [Planctomycetes bacterium Pla163]|uniref:Phage resistance protein n=1 Tax=Rohdeia mirabilis TaxID=2528008 RepID=A0A518D3Z0_9BACT|nr:phage resistance protein [Planctomycetes bacterium Pla163]
MNETLVGRQAIFDRHLAVYAYELLFRGQDIDPEHPESADLATSRVIVDTFTDIGLDKLVADKRAFLNLTRSFITGDHALPVSPETVILEVLETVLPDPEVLEGLARLREVGFTIALDDFVLDEGTRAFMPYADVVKLDVLGKTNAEVRASVAQLKPFGVKLLAEKIETREQYKACVAMGFNYFQGYFLQRPSVVRKRSVQPSQITLLSLLNEMHGPDFNFKRAEQIVQQDVALCYRLLRHINSALFGMPRHIDSVRETLIYLGLENVQNLVSLFLVAGNADTPDELITTAMLRARLCENLGRAHKSDNYRQFFIVGLFSILDALMEAPMDELLARLPLTKDVRAALQHGEGEMGQALAAARAFECGDWDNALCFDLPVNVVQNLYLEALEWAQQVGEVAQSRPSKKKRLAS